MVSRRPVSTMCCRVGASTRPKLAATLYCDCGQMYVTSKIARCRAQSCRSGMAASDGWGEKQNNASVSHGPTSIQSCTSSGCDPPASPSEMMAAMIMSSGLQPSASPALLHVCTAVRQGEAVCRVSVNVLIDLSNAVLGSQAPAVGADGTPPPLADVCMRPHVEPRGCFRRSRSGCPHQQHAGTR